MTEDETESTESPGGGVIKKTRNIKETKTPDDSFSLTLLEQDNRFPVMMYLR